MPHNRMRRVISAADGQALQTAQAIMDAVRSAYQQEPNAMLIADGTLNPLELVVVDGQSGRYYRIPVTGNADGTFGFGAPIPVTGPTSPNAYPSPPGTVNPGQAAASRGVSARDQQRIQAAISRGAIPSSRAAWWSARAAAGEDISNIDLLAGGLIPVEGKVAAAASPEDADYDRLFGPRSAQGDDGGPEYQALFGPVEEGQRRADEVRAARRKEVAAMSDDELYESLFPSGARRSAATAPVAASAAAGAGQHGQREAARKRYRVHTPLVSLRVPRNPDGLAAGADPAQTSWRTIDLHGGDLVPENAHPADIKRLLHQKTRLGPMIKPW